MGKSQQNSKITGNANIILQHLFFPTRLEKALLTFPHKRFSISATFFSTVLTTIFSNALTMFQAFITFCSFREICFFARKAVSLGPVQVAARSLQKYVNWDMGKTALTKPLQIKHPTKQQTHIEKNMSQPLFSTERRCASEHYAVLNSTLHSIIFPVTGPLLSPNIRVLSFLTVIGLCCSDPLKRRATSISASRTENTFRQIRFQYLPKIILLRVIPTMTCRVGVVR